MGVFMKKLMMAALVATFVTPNVSAFQLLTLEIGEMKQDIRVEDFNVSVCNFKKRVSNLVGMEMHEFELSTHGFVLRKGKSLYDENITDFSKVKIRPVDYTDQCS